MERRLTTIVAADIAGFSRLIAADEEGTLAAQRAHRTELIDPMLVEHGGRIANTAGDSYLIEFPSAVEAVRCSVAVQEAMAARNADVPEDRRILYRIGINVGDVVAEGEDLLGDGVNIAARLEALAPPGGILISRAARDQVRDRLGAEMADLGEVEVKNIPRPIRVFQVVREGEAAARITTPRRRWPALAAVAAVLLALVAGGAWWWFDQPVRNPNEKPSIAVLAFDNLSGDPKQEFLSDGLTEDIIGTLARIPDLLVIARNSSFVYKGKPVKVQQVGKELGVQYVLEGSMQMSGDKLRVTAQLIDTRSGHHVWSKKYDRQRADIFAVRDEITRQIVNELGIKIAWGDEFWNRGTTVKNLEAWLLAVESVWLMNKNQRDAHLKSTDLMRKAIQIEPDSAQLHAWLSWRYSRMVLLKWTDDLKAAQDKARHHAERATALDPKIPDGHGALSSVYFNMGDMDAALKHGQVALDLVPNDPGFAGMLAILYQKKMMPEKAIPLFESAIRANPFAPDWVSENLGESLVMAGKYKRAIEVYEKIMKEGRIKGFFLAECHLGLAIAYDGVGRETEARAQIKLATKVFPKFTVSFLRHFQKYANEDYKTRWLATLKRLGLPEK